MKGLENWKKKSKKGGRFSGGAATYGGRPPRRHHLRPTSPTGEDECERREKRASLSRERIERERKEKMEVFIAYNIYICISNHLRKGVWLVMHARAFTPSDLGQTASCGPYNTIP